MTIKPFIKWVGWKQRVLPLLQPLFPKNLDTYHEPFLWGWAVYLSLSNTVKKAYLSDMNEELINAFNVVKNYPNELLSTLEVYVNMNNIEDYKRIRTLNINNLSSIERAWRFIFLKKTSFNGMWRVNKSWLFNVPFWYYNNPNICDRETIYSVSKVLQNAYIEVWTYKNVINNVSAWDFVYFDPPYVPISNTSNFTWYTKDWFWIVEQEELCNLCIELDKMGVNFMLSNSDCEIIRDLYTWFDIKEIQVSRSVWAWKDTRKKVWELVIRNYK